MKKTIVATFPLRFFFAVSLVASVPAYANPRIEELKHCLADFDGIAWKLPYRPSLRIRSCATEALSYDTSDKMPPGSRRLELIGDLILGPDSRHLSSDDHYAALQLAVHTHFDALFKRSGFGLAGVEQGDARTERSVYTACMLAGGGRCTENAEPPPQPPIRYIKIARYIRQIGGQTVTLTYKAELKNTWSITLEGVNRAPRNAGEMR